MNLIKAYHWALCQKDDSDEKVLRGSASLILERRDASAKSVLLDVNKLQVWAQVRGSNQESPYWKSETDLWGVEGNFLSNHLCYWRHERWAAWSTRPLVKSWTLRWTVQVSTGKRWRFFYVLFPLSMAMLLVGIDYFVVLLFVGLSVNVDVIGEVALWSRGEPVDDHGELLHHQRQHGSGVAQVWWLKHWSNMKVFLQPRADFTL